MGDPSYSNSAMIVFTGKIFMVILLVSFFIVGFILFIRFYTRWICYIPREEGEGRQRAAVLPRQRRSLDLSVLKSLPVVDYDSKDFKEGLECAVCISDFVDGEKLRLLPKCNHGFHLECIDMWFQSHSTCPLCRSAVSSSANIVITESNSLETILELPIGEIPDDGPNFPTNVLFCGDETRVVTFGLSVDDITHSHSPPPSSSSSSSSSSSPSSSLSAAAAMGCNRTDGMVVVDIAPRQVDGDEGPKSPLTTRLRSLKRLLSRDQERRSNPSSSGSEAEQGSRAQS